MLVKIGEESRQANVLVTKWLFQAFSGIKEIKVANKESFFITNYDKIIRIVQEYRDSSLYSLICPSLSWRLCVFVV